MAISKKALFALSFLLLPPAAVAGEHSEAIAACSIPAQAVTAAAQLRDTGRAKAEVESTLPPREESLQTPTGRILYAALDDAYEFKDVTVYSHYYYRTYTCMLQNEKRPGPVSFKAVYSDVLKCQSQYSSSESGELGRCLMKAIDAASAAPAGL